MKIDVQPDVYILTFDEKEPIKQVFVYTRGRIKAHRDSLSRLHITTST